MTHAQRGVLVLACLIFGSMPHGEWKAPTPPTDQVVFVIGSWPTNLDPRFPRDAWSDEIAGLVFSTLLSRTSSGEWAPNLAPVVHFASPTEVSVSVKRLFLDSIASVTEGSPTPVRFMLHKAHAPFLQVPTSVEIAQVREIEEDADSHAGVTTGTGPFLFDSAETDLYLSLKGHSDCFAGAPATKRLRFRVAADATVRSLKVL